MFFSALRSLSTTNGTCSAVVSENGLEHPNVEVLMCNADLFDGDGARIAYCIARGQCYQITGFIPQKDPKIGPMAKLTLIRVRPSKAALFLGFTP